MLDFLIANAPEALAAVGGAAVLAAILPRPAPDSPWAKVFAVLDLLAANFLAARNAQVKK